MVRPPHSHCTIVIVDEGESANLIAAMVGKHLSIPRKSLFSLLLSGTFIAMLSLTQTLPCNSNISPRILLALVHSLYQLPPRQRQLSLGVQRHKRFNLHLPLINNLYSPSHILKQFRSLRPSILYQPFLRYNRCQSHHGVRSLPHRRL